ncbi:MAG: cytidylate kinase [SAR116 cluster bacterium]|nr:cytidylate kinase [SAR116 cluster bacterium]
MIIAIDGTAGSGKGTLSKRLSKKLNLPYLDTGILYRKVAFELFKKEKKTTFNFDKDTIKLMIEIIKSNNFVNIKKNDFLRDDKIGLLASEIGKVKTIRTHLNSMQIKFVNDSVVLKKGCILDGRDIGTIILPNADIKFFITASPEVRAKRKLKEKVNANLQPHEQKCMFNKYLLKINERDDNDFNRKISPLKKAIDAFEIDTSDLTPKEVEEIAINKIYKKKT